MSLYDYGPGGYREWFINSGKFRFGSTNRAEVFASQPLQDIAAVSVLEAQIPYTFYTINSSNNVIAVLKIASGVPSGFTVSIPSANYTPETLCTALTSTTATAWPAGTSAAGPLFSAATYTASTGKLVFTVNSAVVTGSGWYFYCNSNQYAQFPVAAAANSLTLPSNLCIEPIGLSDLKNLTDLATTPGSATTLPFIVALGGPPFLAIRANFGIGGSDNIIVCSEGDDDTFGGNILAMIPVNTVPGGTIQWKNNAPRGGFFNLSASAIESGTFWVTAGDDNSVLDFNGHGFQLKLGFMTRSRTNLQSGSRYTRDRNVTSTFG